MKKQLICLLLMLCLLLTGCGQSTPAEAVTEAATEAVTIATTEVPTEPPCDHQWTDANYMEPAKCTQCGEAQGEPKQPYFVEQGLNIVDAPADCVTDGVAYNKTNTRREPVPVYIHFNEWRVNEYGNSSLLNLFVHVGRGTKKCADGTKLDYCDFNTGIYDYYTGQWIHPATEIKNGNDRFTLRFQVDGIKYGVGITYNNDFRFLNLSNPREEPQEDGSVNYYSNYLSDSYSIDYPSGYDGFVFAVIPHRGTNEPHKTETEEFVTHISEEPDFEEGLYFRINPTGVSGDLIQPAGN